MSSLLLLLSSMLDCCWAQHVEEWAGLHISTSELCTGAGDLVQRLEQQGQQHARHTGSICGQPGHNACTHVQHATGAAAAMHAATYAAMHTAMHAATYAAMHAAMHAATQAATQATMHTAMHAAMHATILHW
eukprot:1155754-Pelagomonas_calceolata.AAC.3